MDKKSIVSALISGVVCLLIGFVAGQEYVKYEIRSALGGFASGIQKAFHSDDGNASSAADSAASAPALSPSTPAPAPAAPPPKVAAPSPVTAVLLDKGFDAANPSQGSFESQITLKVTFANTGSKDIRAYEGSLLIDDLLGNRLMSVSYSINDPLPAGKTVENDGGVHFNQFEDADTTLRDANIANLKAKFEPTKVLYADGTSQTWSADQTSQ